MDLLRSSCTAAILVGLFLAGCSGKAVGEKGRVPVYKVSGKITMAGSPVANANVIFSPRAGQPVALGRTDSAGQYTLTTYDAGDGAAEGDFVVLVNKSAAQTAVAPSISHDPQKPNANAFDADAAHAARGAGAASAEADSALPARYTRVDESDLRATVKANGPNDKVDFDLKP